MLCTLRSEAMVPSPIAANAIRNRLPACSCSLSAFKKASLNLTYKASGIRPYHVISYAEEPPNATKSILFTYFLQLRHDIRLTSG